jgi:shikimate kinase
LSNIVLIGMPGAGKSTVGVVLAKTLGMNFIDTDLVIQEREKKLLQEILNCDGTERFLKIEEDCVSSLDCRDSVIATGGSVVYSGSAMKHLKDIGRVIYLRLDYKEIEKRIRNIKTRGVILQKGQTLQDIYVQRLPLYEKYADAVIDCAAKDVEKIVEMIQIEFANK